MRVRVPVAMVVHAEVDIPEGSSLEGFEIKNGLLCRVDGQSEYDTETVARICLGLSESDAAARALACAQYMGDGGKNPVEFSMFFGVLRFEEV